MDMHLEGDRLVTAPVGEWIVAGRLVTYQDKVYLVEKVNPKNYLVWDESGAQYNLRRHPSVKLAVNVEFDKTKVNEKRQAQRDRDLARRTEAFNSELTLGSVVRFKAGPNRTKFPHTYVVCIVPNAKGNCRLAKLGGDNGRYISGAHHSQLETIDPKDI